MLVILSFIFFSRFFQSIEGLRLNLLVGIVYHFSSVKAAVHFTAKFGAIFAWPDKVTFLSDSQKKLKFKRIEMWPLVIMPMILLLKVKAVFCYYFICFFKNPIEEK